jgi:tetratricopeptide (TPR) repeat protein
MNRGCIRWLFHFLVIAAPLTAFSQSPKEKSLEAEADTLYSHEQFEDAAKLYTKIIDAGKRKDGIFENKEIYNTLYKRAVCYYSTREFDKALKDLELFQPAFPRATQPKLLMAFIYRETGDTDKQLSNLNQVIDLQPANPDFLKWRGLLYIQKAQYEKALKDILGAKQFQDDPEIETYLGLCYYNTGKKDSAYLSFNKAIELDATFIASYLYAGRLDGKSKEALFYKGIALVELKRVDEGCRCLNRAFYAGFDDAGDYLAEYCYEVEN